MMTQELFDKHENEHSRFERISDEDKRHPLRDLCAMLYLCERFGVDGGYKAMDAADHCSDWQTCLFPLQ